MYVVLCQVGFDLYFYMIWYIWIQILYSFYINGWCSPVLIVASRGVVDVVLCHCRIVPCRTFQKVVQRGPRQFPSTDGQNSDTGGRLATRTGPFRAMCWNLAGRGASGTNTSGLARPLTGLAWLRGIRCITNCGNAWSGTPWLVLSLSTHDALTYPRLASYHAHCS